MRSPRLRFYDIVEKGSGKHLLSAMECKICGRKIVGQNGKVFINRLLEHYHYFENPWRCEFSYPEFTPTEVFENHQTESPKYRKMIMKYFRRVRKRHENKLK